MSAPRKDKSSPVLGMLRRGELDAAPVTDAELDELQRVEFSLNPVTVWRLVAEARRARAEEEKWKNNAAEVSAAHVTLLAKERDQSLELARLRASEAELEDALRNALAVLLTYDLTEQHGAVAQARAALEQAKKGGGDHG